MKIGILKEKICWRFWVEDSFSSNLETHCNARGSQILAETSTHLPEQHPLAYPQFVSNDGSVITNAKLYEGGDDRDWAEDILCGRWGPKQEGHLDAQVSCRTWNRYELGRYGENLAPHFLQRTACCSERTPRMAISFSKIITDYFLPRSCPNQSKPKLWKMFEKFY